MIGVVLVSSTFVEERNSYLYNFPEDIPDDRIKDDMRKLVLVESRIAESTKKIDLMKYELADEEEWRQEKQRHLEKFHGKKWLSRTLQKLHDDVANSTGPSEDWKLRAYEQLFQTAERREQEDSSIDIIVTIERNIIEGSGAQVKALNEARSQVKKHLDSLVKTGWGLAYDFPWTRYDYLVSTNAINPLWGLQGAPRLLWHELTLEEARLIFDSVLVSQLLLGLILLRWSYIEGFELLRRLTRTAGCLILGLFRLTRTLSCLMFDFGEESGASLLFLYFVLGIRLGQVRSLLRQSTREWTNVGTSLLKDLRGELVSILRARAGHNHND